ncbi:hypothetical protein [Umezawaea sp. Da 62-37]|uniref:hypothetical protein n=1 Tax=Umezawaea sp. Da 62-37 TaxID=3075927 RepID=UPI0028F6FFC8|nr:hypothetical protein [Umezawaea sp. Da 62-37]WNV86596.1 hypothetical protein RM788_52210 [Umezawaea sp. Da 62-37]
MTDHSTDDTAAPSDPTDEDTSGTTLALDDHDHMVILLRDVQARLDLYGKMRKDVQNYLKDVLGDAEVGTLAGRPAVTWKSTLRIAVSQKLLKQRYPAIARECEDITSVHTFKLLDS